MFVYFATGNLSHMTENVSGTTLHEWAARRSNKSDKCAFISLGTDPQLHSNIMKQVGGAG